MDKKKNWTTLKAEVRDILNKSSSISSDLFLHYRNHFLDPRRWFPLVVDAVFEIIRDAECKDSLRFDSYTKAFKQLVPKLGIPLKWAKIRIFAKFQSEFKISRNMAAKSKDRLASDGENLASIPMCDEIPELDSRLVVYIRFFGNLFKGDMVRQADFKIITTGLLSGKKGNFFYFCELWKLIQVKLATDKSELMKTCQRHCIPQMEKILTENGASPTIRAMFQEFLNYAETMRGFQNSNQRIPVPKNHLDTSNVPSTSNHKRKRTNHSLSSSPLIVDVEEDTESFSTSPNNSESFNQNSTDTLAASSGNETSLDRVKRIRRETEDNTDQVIEVVDLDNVDQIIMNIEAEPIESNDRNMNNSNTSHIECVPNNTEVVDSNDGNLSCTRFKKAAQCMLELLSADNIPGFINITLNDILPKSKQRRHAFGQALCYVLKNKTITFKLCEEGFAENLNNMKNYPLDSLQWKGMFEVLRPVAEEYRFTNLFVKEILRPSRPHNDLTLLSVLFHCFVRIKNTSYSQKVCVALGIDVPCNTTTDVNESTDTEAHAAEQSDTILFRAIVKAIHELSLKDCESGRLEVDSAFLKEKMSLLNYCMQSSKKLELQVLFTIQRLVNELKHPDGVLQKFFDILYENDMIRQEVFQEWVKNKDPSKVRGKAAALRSVETFLNWIK